jgi:hypothetical protein
VCEAFPKKNIGDHLHLAGRTILSVIPKFGGAAVELFNAVITPPLERRRNEWLKSLADRLSCLEQEGRLRIEDLANNDEFVSAVLQATTAALRNHRREKLEALRNAVLNSALGLSPEDTKREIFLSLVDQFSALHLKALAALADSTGRKSGARVKTNIEAITDSALTSMPELKSESDLVRIVVEDMCHKGLLFWTRNGLVSFIPTDARQITPLGEEFLRFISEPVLQPSSGEGVS